MTGLTAKLKKIIIKTKCEEKEKVITTSEVRNEEWKNS